MDIIPILLKEMAEEAVITRKMLACVPNDKYDWQPHPKSMTIRQLTGHIAELPEWVSMAIHTTELDFAANPYEPRPVTDTQSVLDFFEKTLAQATTDLSQTNEDVLTEQWTLRNGAHIIIVRNKMEVIRMTFNQMTHHRAQLGVYLRLLNIPIPGSYGPSADELGK